MKKFVVLVLLGVFLVTGGTLAVLNTLEKGKTTVLIEKAWELSSNEISSIFLNGTQQDLDITIERTEDSFSQLLIDGKVPEESAEVLKTSEVSANHLYLPFAEKGFRLVVSPSGKDRLDVTLKLAKTARFKEFKVETWTGDITLTVPKDFSGKFDLEAHGGNISQNISKKGNSHQKIIIDTYGDIRVLEK